MPHHTSALIVGAGQGLSACLARLFAKHGMQVSLAARDPKDLDALAAETNARAYACDATKREDVECVFATLDAEKRTPDVVVYNASYRTRGPLIELDPDEVHKALHVTAFGGFLVAQAAV